MRRMCVLALVCLTLLFTAPIGSGQSGTEPKFDPIGLQPKRGYFAQLPFESVDMVNGNLLLTFTDLALPGNAGMDLRVQRTFNKQANRWTFGLAGVPMEVINPEAPWPEGSGESRLHPTLRTADGTDHGTTPYHSLESTDVWITEQFWRYTLATRTVELPNGWTATYSSNPGRALLDEIRDPFGNTLRVDWDSFDPQDFTTRRPIRFSQSIGGETREVSFTYETSWATMPKTMTFDGRTWLYDYLYDPWRLIAVNPPEGPSWQFDYAAGLRVTTPNGGTVRYVFDGQVFPDLGEGERQVVRQRITGGRDVPSGTWHFTYAPQSGSQIGSFGTVDTPDGRRVEFRHEWAALGGRWAITQKRVLDGSHEVARMQRHYTFLSIVPWASSLGTVPVPETETIEQDGRTYTTHYAYRPNDAANRFGDFHKPSQITESQSGGPTRTITRHYDYDFGSLYLLHRTLSETVSTGGQSFTITYGHEDSTGFLVEQTTYGVTGQFGRDGAGNRASARDANGHTTHFSYERGVLKDTVTPEYTIGRTINFDGTVASEGRAGLTTWFGYDDLGRIRSVDPPGGDATVTDYFADRVTTSRGPTFTTTYVDGFGRPIGTLDAEGVGTAIAYDADGRKVFQSFPFGPQDGSPNHGDVFDYDALGRISRVTHPDGSTIQYDYSGGSVTIRDEEGRVTVQRWEAFGDPADARLVALIDANGREWRYGYNGLGNLTQVVSPDGKERRWTYDGQNRLRVETHPESGTTEYSYDNAGNLKRKADAVREVFYDYDHNNRLTGISTPEGADDVGIEYDDFDNRTLLATNVVRSEFGYVNNRLELRRDTILGHAFETRYGYDSRDNLRRIDYPSGRFVIYDYDAADRITRVRGNGQAGEQVFAHTIAYHPSGAIKSYTFGNGAREEIGFDGRFRPERVRSGPFDVTYGYDHVGNVRSIADPRPGFSSQFWYDNLDRLETVTGFGERTFTYDDHGNRLTKSAGGVQYTYDGQLRLASITGGVEAGTVTYDPAGNVKSDPGGGTYTYTHLNMLATATVGGNTSVYGYDGDSLRKYRSTPDGVYYYVHGQGAQILAEYDATSGQPEVMREYIYLGAKLLASIGRGNVPDPPFSVRLTNPRNGDRFPNDEELELRGEATVTIPGETIAQVEFYYDGVFIGSDTTAPYSVNWLVPYLPAGEYMLMARAVTASGQAAVSSPVSVRFFPVGRVTGITVMPESPAAGQTATVTVTGNVNPCGAVGLDFGDGEAAIYPNLPDGGALSDQPFVRTHAWAEAGIKIITASGHGNCRGVVTHHVTVKGPQVTLTSPAAGAVFITPATIALAADATDTGNQAITRVDFYAGGELLGSDATEPYTFTWHVADVGLHVVVAKAVNASGVTGASLPVTVRVDPPPLTIAVDPASPAATVPALVTIGGPGGCTSVNVDFGDGTTETFLGDSLPITRSHAWPTAGTRTITAVGLGAACPSQGSTTVTVLPAPPLSITVEPGSPAAGSAAQVTVHGPGTCSSVNVDYGDGTSATFMGALPVTNTHTWTSAGTKTVTATGLGAACNVQAAASVTVQPPAGALGITVSPSAPVAGSSAVVTITGPSTCTGVTVNYGDGTSETLTSASGLPVSSSHTWTSSGTATVTASSAGGTCGSSASATVTVQPPPPPPLTISVNPASPTAGIPAQVTIDGPGACTSVNVFFGDGTSQTFMGSGPPLTSSHTWTTAGTKTITAQGLGSACDIQGTATVTVQPAPPPLTIGVNPSSPVVGSSAVVTIGGPSTCTAVTVTYGDGTSETLTSAAGLPVSSSHTWTSSGTKTVTASGAGGTCGSSASATVTVQPPPPPPLTISVNPASPTAGIPAQITIDGPGACTSVNVFFGDGTSQTFMGSGPPLTNSHTWTTAGSKTITAQGLGAACDIQATATVTVQPAPAPLTIGVNPTSPVVGTSAVVTIGGPNTCTAVTVSYGDGTSQTLTNASGLPVSSSHTWTTTGTKTVTATGAGGTCGSPASVSVTVQPPPPPPLTITLNPASPTAGAPAQVTIDGPSACTSVNVFFGDGTSQTFMGSGPPLTNSHTWTTAGARTITAQGLGSACDIQAAKSITVLAPPAVSITAPTGGDAFLAPATIAIAASATPAQGSITRVDFYANGGLIASDTTAPYTYSWTGVGNGTYSLTARAIDSFGAAKTSSPVSVIVGTPPPSTVFGITVTPNPVAAGQTATITVTGTNPCGMLEMHFGDGDWWIAPINGLPFTTTHTWAAGGTYTVVAKGFMTCGGQATRAVTVTGAPDEPDAALASFMELAPFAAAAFAGRLPAAPGAAPAAVVDAPAPSVDEPAGAVNVLDIVEWGGVPPPVDEGTGARHAGPFAYPEPETTAARAKPHDAGAAGDGDRETEASGQSTVTLTVNLTGTGSGTVSGAGISCPGGLGVTCQETFSSGAVITLTPSADAGSAFKGWGGACAGTGACTVTLSRSLLVVATFNVPPPMVTQYYHLDVLGSVRAVTNEAGALVRRQDYAAFGEDMLVDEPQPLPASAKQPQFTGKERDSETLLDYFGARYYRPMWGRFTSVDPVLILDEALIDPQRWARYPYTRNNPLRFADPTGAAIELIGTASEREQTFGLLRDAVGSGAGEQLYINEVTIDGVTRYFVGIRGDVGDFMRMNQAAHQLANLVLHPSIIEATTTGENLSRFGGAVTFEPGEVGNTNVRILVNPSQVQLALTPNTVIGRSRFEGQNEKNPWTIRRLSPQVALWHEFGHSWGFVNGRLMKNTNPEALDWENTMRAMQYGPLGPRNARRIKH